jgi:hypothetical protein
MSLKNRKNDVLHGLETYLKSFQVNEPLPDKKVIRRYLTFYGSETLEITNKEYAQQANLLKELIDSWIFENLKQVREILSQNNEKKIIDFSEVDTFESPNIDLSSSIGVGLLTGIIGLFLNPGAAFIAAFAGFLGNLLISAKEKRENTIARTIEESRKRYDPLFAKITVAYMETIDEHSKAIIDYANNKIRLFFSDLQTQTDRLNMPISDTEQRKYQLAFAEIEQLRHVIQKSDLEIRSCYSSI